MSLSIFLSRIPSCVSPLHFKIMKSKHSMEISNFICLHPPSTSVPASANKQHLCCHTHATYCGNRILKMRKSSKLVQNIYLIFDSPAYDTIDTLTIRSDAVIGENEKPTICWLIKRSTNLIYNHRIVHLLYLHIIRPVHSSAATSSQLFVHSCVDEYPALCHTIFILPIDS